MLRSKNKRETKIDQIYVRRKNKFSDLLETAIVCMLNLLLQIHVFNKYSFTLFLLDQLSIALKASLL